jgi:excisionase family DNA binding protein
VVWAGLDVASILPSAAAVAEVLDRTLLIEEAARLLGVSRRTIYYRIREGRLRTVRTRCGSQRIFVSSIESLLREIREREGQRLARLIGGRRTRPSASETKPLAL